MIIMGNPVSEGTALPVDSGSSGDATGMNPAWNDVLGVIPQELHQQVIPHFQQWDKGVNDRFQKVHSEYEAYKPLKEAGYDRDSVEFMMRLTEGLNTDPKQVYEAIGEYFNLTPQEQAALNASGQGQGGPNVGDEDPYAAKFAEYDRQNEILAGALYQQRQSQLDADEDARLDAEFSALQDKYKDRGGFNEQMVVGLMLADENLEPEQAVEQYLSWREGEVNNATARMPKPLIMGSGGGLPSQQVDVTKMSGPQTKNLVAQMLEAHSRQNQ